MTSNSTITWSNMNKTCSNPKKNSRNAFKAGIDLVWTISSLSNIWTIPIWIWGKSKLHQLRLLNPSNSTYVSDAKWPRKAVLFNNWVSKTYFNVFDLLVQIAFSNRNSYYILYLIFIRTSILLYRHFPSKRTYLSLNAKSFSYVHAKTKHRSLVFLK